MKNVNKLKRCKRMNESKDRITNSRDFLSKHKIQKGVFLSEKR